MKEEEALNREEREGEGREKGCVRVHTKPKRAHNNVGKKRKGINVR